METKPINKIPLSFAEWVQKNNWTKLASHPEWVQKSTGDICTGKELFELYLINN